MSRINIIATLRTAKPEGRKARKKKKKDQLLHIKRFIQGRTERGETGNNKKKHLIEAQKKERSKKFPDPIDFSNNFRVRKKKDRYYFRLQKKKIKTHCFYFILFFFC